MPTPPISQDGQELPAPKPLAPVKLSPACPSCGRKDVVVFPTFYTSDGKPTKKARLICAACSPRMDKRRAAGGDDDDDGDFVAHVEKSRSDPGSPIQGKKPPGK